MAGKLDAVVAGQTLTFRFDDRKIFVETRRLTALRRIPTGGNRLKRGLGMMLKLGSYELVLVSPSGKHVELFPSPPWYLRWFNRDIRQLNQV